jgi:hypothetical protein
MMRKISLVAVAGALIATGFGVWAAVPTNKALVTLSTGHGIKPYELMVNAKGLPTTEFVDYTFVFH